MNKRIRSLIDEIFSEMKMTAENLALRDELMANAQARYEDAVSGGKTEEEAFAEVAASLGDVRALLREMNDEPRERKIVTSANATLHVDEDGDTLHVDGEEEEEPEDNEDEAGSDGPSVSAEVDLSDLDIGGALNKAFSALGDFGRQIMPQAKKLAKQVDDATGGALDELSRAAQKGMRDAQKAAGETIDRLKKGELTVDFSTSTDEGSHSSEELREEAKDLRAQAEIKQAVGDQEGARELRARAYELETRADALEQAQAMREASDAAAQDADGAPQESYVGEDGELDEGAFTKAVDDMMRDAQEVIRESEAAVREGADTLRGFARDARQAAAQEVRFPAAGLRAVDVKVDADDVRVEPSDEADVCVRWQGMAADRQPVVTMDGHTLCVRRANPDVFKTFFSVFAKDGGQIVVRVPRGYAADYSLSTTSGDVMLSGVDVDDVRVNSTSGGVRVEPDAGIRAKEISVGTVSGDVTVSACAGDVKVNTVSGDQFVSCDANRVDVDCVSGEIHIEGACDEWEVNSVSGDAALICTVAPSRKIQLGTVSGDVRVTLPGDIRGFVAEMSGMSGHIENEFGPNRYGTCALPIHMDTISGNLAITRL